MHPIQKAADSLGGLAPLARALGVSYQAVKFWVDGDRMIEPIRCVQIERLTGVPRWELRPGDWNLIWPELIGTAGAPAVPTETTEAA